MREEKDDRLEALLQAEVAMVPRLAAASGELAEGGLQARVCGLGIGEGGRLVGPLPGLSKLESSCKFSSPAAPSSLITYTQHNESMCHAFMCHAFIVLRWVKLWYVVCETNVVACAHLNTVSVVVLS